MPNERVPLVGVTGGIGSGKSEVCRILGALGRTVISADAVAHALTEGDPAVRAAIVRAFGQEIYGPDGALRRGELARIVFGDDARRKALDAIVHPKVFASLEEALSRLPAAAQRPYVVVEAALVFESGMDRRLDATVLVRAAEEVRMERVMRRDGMARPDVLARMRAQIAPASAAAKADVIIDNDGTIGGLEERVVFVDRMLALRFAQG